MGPRTIPDGSAVAHADKWIETKCLSSGGDVRVIPRHPVLIRLREVWVQGPSLSKAGLPGTEYTVYRTALLAP